MPKSRQPSFSLVELVTVLVILSILAAVAFSSYAKFNTRARISEAYHLLEEYKNIANNLQITEDEILPYYVLFTDEDTSGFVSGTPAGSAAVKTVGSEYVATLEAYSGTTGGLPYILIGAGLQNDGHISSGSDHVYIAGVVAANGSITWSCGLSTSRTDDVPAEYLPNNCDATLP